MTLNIEMLKVGLLAIIAVEMALLLAWHYRR